MDLDNAIDLMNQNPSDMKLRYRVSKIALNEEKYDLALKALLPILQEMPEESDLWFNVGTCYLELGDEERAYEAYERSFILDPESADAVFNLGVLSHDPEEEMAHYLKALELGHSDARYNLALMLVDEGREQEARPHFEHLLVEEPDNESLKYLIAAIDGETPDTAPPEFVSDLFDQYADTFDEHLVGELKYQTPQHLLEIMLPHLLPSHSVLDLGCGTGLMGAQLAGKVSRIVGVDLSPKMLEKADEKGCYDELHCKELNVFMQNCNERFDWVVAADVLIYIGDLGPTAALVPSVMTEHGRFIYTVESSEHHPYKLQSNRRYGHTRQYLDALASENHLQLVKTEAVVLREQEGEPVHGYIDELIKV